MENVNFINSKIKSCVCVCVCVCQCGGEVQNVHLFSFPGQYYSKYNIYS